MNLQELRASLRQELGPLLGTVDAASNVRVEAGVPQRVGTLTVERVRLDVGEAGGTVPLPLILLRDESAAAAANQTAVVMVAQGGKERLLRERADAIASCLNRGATVVLPDLRGTGETMPAGEGRGRTGGATSRSSTEQMLGETMLGRRLRDLRTVLAYLRGRNDLKEARFALYGDGLVAANAPALDAAAPLDAENLPAASEPLGALVCLSAALWDDSIAAVYAAGGMTSFATMLEEAYFYVPHDALPPGVLAQADVADLLAAQTAQVTLADCRDGANRPTSADERARLVETVRTLAAGRNDPKISVAEAVPSAAATVERLLTAQD